MKTIKIDDKICEPSIVFKNQDIIIIKSMRDFNDTKDDQILIDGFVLMLVKQGHATMTIDGYTFNLQPGNLFGCSPRNIIEDIMVSVDVEVSGIFVTSKFVSWIINETNLDVTRFVLSRNHSIATLDSDQQTLFISFLDMLRSLLNTSETPHKNKSVLALFQSFAYCITDYANEEEESITDVAYTSAENIFRRFMMMLGESSGNFDNVNGYAEKLHITPKYFSNICKKLSGKTASQLINEQIIKEAKIQLRDPSLNIKQIASNLGFANPSHFGTFIRRNTGKSPQALRDSL